MNRTLYLEPREVKALPVMRTHREFCLWLSARGSLKPEHRACMSAETCVAVKGFAVHPQGSWQGRR